MPATLPDQEIFLKLRPDHVFTPMFQNWAKGTTLLKIYKEQTQEKQPEQTNNNKSNQIRNLTHTHTQSPHLEFQRPFLLTFKGWIIHILYKLFQRKEIFPN